MGEVSLISTGCLQPSSTFNQISVFQELYFLLVRWLQPICWKTKFLSSDNRAELEIDFCGKIKSWLPFRYREYVEEPFPVCRLLWRPIRL